MKMMMKIVIVVSVVKMMDDDDDGACCCIITPWKTFIVLRLRDIVLSLPATLLPPTLPPF